MAYVNVRAAWGGDRLGTGVLLSMVIALAGALFASSAAAQPADSPERTAAARALFEQGMAAVDAGDWATAADHLRRSLALRASPVVRFNLALALSELGRFVEASEHLRAVQREAPEGSDAARLASERLAAIVPRMGRLRIDLSGPREGAEVRLDGAAVPEPLLGVEQPADPGVRRVTLHRTERGAEVELAAREVTVTSGSTARVSLEAPPLPVPTPEEVAARATMPDPSPTTPPPSDDGVERQWWFWTLIAVLVIGAGVAIGAGIAASNQSPPVPPMPPDYIVGDSGNVHATILELP